MSPRVLRAEIEDETREKKLETFLVELGVKVLKSDMWRLYNCWRWDDASTKLAASRPCRLIDKCLSHKGSVGWTRHDNYDDELGCEQSRREIHLRETYRSFKRLSQTSMNNSFISRTHSSMDSLLQFSANVPLITLVNIALSEHSNQTSLLFSRASF